MFTIESTIENAIIEHFHAFSGTLGSYIILISFTMLETIKPKSQLMEKVGVGERSFLPHVLKC